jgi:hypothetical protein
MDVRAMGRSICAHQPEDELLFAMGVHGQNLFIDRANHIVIAKFSSWSQPTDGRALWLTHTAVAEIGRCLS